MFADYQSHTAYFSLYLNNPKFLFTMNQYNGSQPTSIRYENFCNTLVNNHITTSYSNPKGNADTERFFRTFKEEIIWTRDYDKFDKAKKPIEYFVEFYNNEYPHSALGYMSPVDFEKQNILFKDSLISLYCFFIKCVLIFFVHYKSGAERKEILKLDDKQ